jgi:gliding motility-associated protein GldM
MSLPKEPRQKMINMMYLVLTALLALNVSSEILNAFKTVNTSLTNANNVIATKNETVYSSFEAMMKDAQTAEKAKFWQPFAEEAKKLSAETDAYLEGLKQTLKKESGLKIEDGVEHFKEDDLDASSRLFDKRGEGEVLRKKLEDYKAKLLNTLDPARYNDPATKKAITEKRAELEKTLPLDLSIPKSQTGELSQTWTSAYFHMTPTIASLTILSKFQNDVKNSESQVVDFFLKQVGTVKVVFDEFQAFAGTNSTYLMPGDELEITAGVGAFSKAAKPDVYINGAKQPLNNEGVAVYKTNVSGAGDRSVAIKIDYTKPDGNIGTVNKIVKYTVGIPSGASIFLSKMNVVYAGVDNPVVVSAGSAGLEKMNVSFAAGQVIPAGGNGKYIIKPSGSKLGEFNLNVTVEGKTTPFPLRVKRLPPPTGMVGGNKGGTMSTAQFKASGGLVARLLDSDFEAPFSIVSYKLGANGGPFQNYQEASNDGARWTGGAQSIVSRAAPGASVFFDDIRVKGPDGSITTIPPIIFQLK